MTPGQKLKRALASENVVFAPLTLDALTGRIAEQAGFPAGYISGGALGFAHGVSEALLTLSEIADVTQHVTARSHIAVIVDAGVGTASDATVAMELGCDGVLMNTAIAQARDPVLMASAMRKGIEAGREAFLAGRMPRRRYASASSPLDGTFF